ncbi:MAG: MJ1477/TM1410 family putative glycoside hydrolase [Myxococcaceae bacterium]
MLVLPAAFGLWPGSASAEGRERIRAVKSWGYQLQGQNGRGLDHSAVAASPFDLVVVDFADRGVPLSFEQVGRLKKRASGKPRLVLAYLSIGEAENYRFYWKTGWKAGRPAFLADGNPDWPGNFKVRFWLPQWQKLLFGVTTGAEKSYLDRIVDAGFDGAYLDIIDAFEYFGPDGKRPERKLAAQDMTELVERLASHAREARGQPGFLVVPQNGANILDGLAPARVERYLSAIDGIGAEDTFFYGERDEDNPLAIQLETLTFLDRFQGAGKVVLSVDYLTDKAKVARFGALAREHGFVPYAGRRELDRLVPQPAWSAPESKPR